MRNQTKYIPLRVILIFLVLGNLIGIYKAIFLEESLTSSYARIPTQYHSYFILLPLFSIVALAAIWVNKKWDLYFISIVTVCVLLIDLYARFWAHAIAAFIAFILLVSSYVLSKK